MFAGVIPLLVRSFTSGSLLYITNRELLVTADDSAAGIAITAEDYRFAIRFF